MGKNLTRQSLRPCSMLADSFAKGWRRQRSPRLSRRRTMGLDNLGEGIGVPTSIMLRLCTGRFRHVVFASSMGPRRSIDFAPAEACEEIEPKTQKLSREEESFIDWLFAQAGLDARIYRRETLRRR